MQSRLILAAIAVSLIVLVLALLWLFSGGSESRLPAVSGSIILKRKDIRLGTAQGKAAGKAVEYVGDPIEAAKVTFMQGAEEVGFGVTDASGRFRIKSVVDGEERLVDGIPPGAYKVKVTRLLLVADPAAVTKGATSATSGPKPSLPAKYADPETSGLTAVVVEPPAEQDPALPPPNFFPYTLEE